MIEERPVAIVDLVHFLSDTAAKTSYIERILRQYDADLDALLLRELLDLFVGRITIERIVVGPGAHQTKRGNDD